MPNLSEGPIQLFDNSVTSINFALAQVLERFDISKGLRGEPTIYAATTVGAPGAQQQAARLADLPTEDPTSELLWLLLPKPGSAGARPADLVDGTGGTANNTLTALGGITVLTDNTGGAAPDNTLQVIPAAAGDGGGLAMVSAANAVATVASVNTALTAIANDLADLAAKVNTLVNDMNDARDNDADLAAKVNAVMAQLALAGVLL